MAFFLVDLEFRKKARYYLTSREVLFVFFFLIFALLPWTDIIELARRVGLDPTYETNSVGPEDIVGVDAALGMEDHCNPKFPKTCRKT